MLVSILLTMAFVMGWKSRDLKTLLTLSMP